MGGSATTYAIGAVSKQTGCHIEIIRYYERIGLLSAPTRRPSGYRRYNLAHLKRGTKAPSQFPISAT
jgi:DNA-binding transcriptional MerR regulator